MKNIIKLILQITILSVFTSSAYALKYEVGAATGLSITEPELLNALKAGKSNIKGFKIVLKQGVKVPNDMRQSWMAKQLSGETTPAEGTKSDSVIFIEDFN